MSVSRPTDPTDPITARILGSTGERLPGFQRNPMAEIARLTGITQEVVIDRLRACLDGGVLRRIHQAPLASSAADGVLCAWQVPAEQVEAAFDFLFSQDPFTSQVIERHSDNESDEPNFTLWSVLKIPQGFSLNHHAEWLAEKIQAEGYRLMPVRKLFTLGVGQARRRDTEPGSRAQSQAEASDVGVLRLNEQEWQVLTAVTREFTADELGTNLWQGRANEAGLSLSKFFQVAEALTQRGVLGRFSAIKETVKTAPTGERVTKLNALFLWSVPRGREVEAGREIGRHHIMTQTGWREGGPAFQDANVMGIALGADKESLLAHQAAITEHLVDAGISVSHTDVFWAGRSDSKPGELSPLAYAAWCTRNGLDVDAMREPGDAAASRP